MTDWEEGVGHEVEKLPKSVYGIRQIVNVEGGLPEDSCGIEM
jgi:hypothetical protein